MESINLEEVPGFNNNNEHYKNHLHLNPSLTDLGVHDLGDTYLPKNDPYKGGQDVRTLISTTHHTYTAWPKIFDNGQKLTVEFRPKLSF